jgi:hypothetical protein
MGVWALGAALGQAILFSWMPRDRTTPGMGASWATAKKTLQAAVNLAVTRAIRWWATNGVYLVGGAAAGGASNVVVLGTNMALRG